jgi:nucleotide-binding universal stress UspA family protein
MHMTDDWLNALNRGIDEATFGVASLEPSEDAETAPPGPVPVKRIVVAVDGSTESDHALAWAARFSSTFHARVCVVHVTPDLASGAFYADLHPAGVAVDLDAAARADGQRILEDAVAFLGKENVDAEGVLRTGSPVEEVRRMVAEREADVVILGSRGKGRVERMLLGSVSDGVKNRVPASVLIARGPPRRAGILVATDGSRESKRAAATAVNLAHAWEEHATVTHVLPDIALADPELRGEGRVPAFGDLTPTDGDARLKFLLLQGNAAACIVRAARDRDVDLVVTGSRGLTGVRSVVAGSVSNRVAHEANASVLIVKSPA